MNNRLREVREKKGITQTQLAKDAGVCRPVIIKLENEEEYFDVRVSTLVKIAQALSEPMGSIFFN